MVLSDSVIDVSPIEFGVILVILRAMTGSMDESNLSQDLG